MQNAPPARPLIMPNRAMPTPTRPSPPRFWPSSRARGTKAIMGVLMPMALRMVNRPTSRGTMT